MILTPLLLPSPSNKTLPEPLGKIGMLPSEADTIELPFTSKLPPKLGDESSETFDNPAPAAALTDINDRLPEPSVDKTWFVSPSLLGKVNVTF